MKPAVRVHFLYNFGQKRWGKRSTEHVQNVFFGPPTAGFITAWTGLYCWPTKQLQVRIEQLSVRGFSTVWSVQHLGLEAETTSSSSSSRKNIDEVDDFVKFAIH